MDMGSRDTYLKFPPQFSLTCEFASTIQKRVRGTHMPKATERYNLHIINRGLAKEWHPTRNGDLNPRNVTPGSGKKVWWICAQGHEWEATVYSRNRGSGCPSCKRPKLADKNDLFVSNPDLVKEWHLTKNSGLNLRNLPPDFNQKVWWICAEGHEWKDTIRNRINGKQCPNCKKDLKSRPASRTTKRSRHRKEFNPEGAKASRLKDILQPLHSQSSAATGFRKNTRYRHKATVILEDPNSGTWSYARTKDLSNDGLLLESAVAFRPGTRINIKFDTQSFETRPKIFNSTVKWCKELADENSIPIYGIGVKFI